MDQTVVDRLYADFIALIDLLGSAEPSLKIFAEDNLRKALLLASASHFEHRVKNDLIALTRDLTPGSDLLVEFVKAKAIERQYHTYFQWGSRNANSFFGLFGAEFKSFMKERLDSDAALADSIRAFIELGNDRNRLVHQDYGSFSLEKTAEEIFALYQKATLFVDSLRGCFEDYLDRPVPADTRANGAKTND